MQCWKRSTTPPWQASTLRTRGITLTDGALVIAVFIRFGSLSHLLVLGRPHLIFCHQNLILPALFFSYHATP